MANKDHVNILKQGRQAWNHWREDHPEIDKPDLSEEKLSWFDLSNANLHKVNLYWADLHNTNFRDANLSEANLQGTNLYWTQLEGANLEGANLTYAVLNNTNLKRANLTNCKIHGIAAWDLQLEGATQSGLIISRPEVSLLTVDDIEVAQFVYLLLHNEKIRNVLNTVGKKAVLLIGRFTEERKAILHAIKNELRNRYDLLPIMFEFDPLSTEPTIKTLSTLAHLSRFVIADLTEAKSILQELTTILHELPTLPVQPILHESAEMPPMGDSFLVMQSFLKPYAYSTKEKLIADLPAKVVGPAQNRANEFESKLAEFRQKWLPWQST